MSKQLMNETNEIKLVNSAKRINKHMSSNNSNNRQRQSIKLQIELPYIDNSKEIIRMKKKTTSSTFNNDNNNNIESDQDDTDDNQTIRLQISFDSRPRFTPRKSNQQLQQERTAKKQSSSGYSSSNSSMINYICSSNNNTIKEKSFYLHNDDEDDDQFGNNFYNNQRFSNENIYDKLNYNVSSFSTTSNKRKSMASVDSSMSSTTSTNSSSTSNSSSLFASTSKPSKDYYEEISNFTQLESSNKQRTYENELILKPVAQVRSQVFKREYTVNEIFQNLESFKIEAKQQEKLNNNYETIGTNHTDKNNIISNKPKSVSFLKQIFETKLAKKTASVECLSGVKIQQQQQQQQIPIIIQQTKQHVYVNEKLSRL